MNRSTKGKAQAPSARATSSRGTPSFEDNLKSYNTAGKSYVEIVAYYEKNLPKEKAIIYLKFFIDIGTKIVPDDKYGHRLKGLLKKDEYKNLDAAVPSLKNCFVGAGIEMLMKVLIKKSVSSLPSEQIQRFSPPHYADESYLDILNLDKYYSREIKKYIGGGEIEIKKIVVEAIGSLSGTQAGVAISPSPLASTGSTTKAPVADPKYIKDELENEIDSFFELLISSFEEYFRKRPILKGSNQNQKSAVETAVRYIKFGADLLRMHPKAKVVGLAIKSAANFVDILAKKIEQPLYVSIIDKETELKTLKDSISKIKKDTKNSILRLSFPEMTSLREFYKELNEKPYILGTGWKFFDWAVFLYHLAEKGTLTLNLNINIKLDARGLLIEKNSIYIAQAEESESFQAYWVGLIVKYTGIKSKLLTLDLWTRWSRFLPEDINAGYKTLLNIMISWPSEVVPGGSVTFSPESLWNLARPPSHLLQGDTKLFASFMQVYYLGNQRGNSNERDRWTKYEAGTGPLPEIPILSLIDESLIKFYIIQGNGKLKETIP
ncbi:MAG: hypothetical protein H6559_29780 [Lewinellaceae bacterium]|nr:hypothetical protein [Lewinellaceae bacterium]